MGRPKAGLDWHGSTLLRRVVGILARSVDGPVVVVAAAGQPLPALPDLVEVVTDSLPGRGPLQGLVDGLGALGDRAAVAFVSATDVPLLHPSFVRAVVRALDAAVDIAAPELDGRLHTLAAAYRVDAVLPLAERLLAEDQLAMRTLLEHARIRRLTAGELPAPESLTNLNSPGDYTRATTLPAPPVTVNGAPTQAWTLGDVVAGHARVSLNGAPVGPDPEFPLVAGDALTLN